MATSNPWDPAQYERFKSERSRPFFDLLSLVHPREGMRVVDLGCGTGELTGELHARLGAVETLGIDSSEAMLAKAAAFEKPGLRFACERIEDWKPAAPFDVVFSNAALHWVDDQRALLARLRTALAPGGQLAVQVPANDDHPSHAVAGDVAREEPFCDELDGFVRRSSNLALGEYAELLDELGFRDQIVGMRVYAHHLPSRADVAEWVKGTLLTEYAKRLRPESYAAFLTRYRQLLSARLGPDTPGKPYFYGFKRMLIWGGNLA
jgi:trans-aconitate 2-methyltransferase